MNSQDFRSLQEAYLEVVENQQLDELSVNKMHAYINKAEKDRDRLNKKWDQGTATPKERKKVFDREEGEARASKKIRQKTGKDSFRLNALDKLKSAITKEEVDIYDIILSHLLDEGYAETPEAAKAIMVNMSEEWRDSIVEEVEQLDEISLKTKMSAYARSQDPDADYQYGSKVHAQGDRIKKAIVKKHGEKAGEHAERHADAEHWGRKDASGKRKGLPKPRIQKNRDYRTTKAGKMHGQDQSKLKRDLKYNRFVED
jgi:hypothetical protein